LTSLSERQALLSLFEEAVQAGARRSKASEVLGISLRTLQRWKPTGEDVKPDLRPLAQRPAAQNRLSPEEREEILNVCNSDEYASFPPAQIVPKLADKGVYLASESTFYRTLRAAGQLNHRGRARKRRSVGPPRTHLATGPNEVWSWDITFLPSVVRGQFYYLYMVEDVYSRYGIAWEVHDRESGELASELVQKALLRERCYVNKPVLHADNGSAMKSHTLRSKLHDLGIEPSYSRPGVSDDNAYVESFFKTLKYCPKWPVAGFSSIEEARKWVQRFMSWYNNEHQHSRIRFVTPAQRHRREDVQILAQRDKIYATAKALHPERWSGKTRNWTPVGSVTLNPVNLPHSELNAA
jgi:putative transposase